eukprot:403349172
MNIALPNSINSRLRLYGVSPNSGSGSQYQPASRFAQSIEEIYRRTNKNLNTWVIAGQFQHQMGAVAQGPMDYYTNSNITSKRYNDDGNGYMGSAQYVQPTLTSQASRSAAIAFYPNRNESNPSQNVYKPASSNGFQNQSSNSGHPQQQYNAMPTQKTVYIRSHDGQDTIEHAPEQFDFGTISEDIEAHYVQANHLQNRGRSQNSRPGGVLLRTIDDNLQQHRDVLKNQKQVFDYEMEERQRIFEDEIIKRIKIIQNYIKSLDSKFTKFREKQLKKKFDDNVPERLSQNPNSRIPSSSNFSQSDIKELIKWELEVLEKKSEDRFSKIEIGQKTNKKKYEEGLQVMRDETTNEFENIKNQFEEFGNNIYERITGDLLQQIQSQMDKQSQELSLSLREETNSVLMQGLTQSDQKLMNFESQIEDIRIGQEQSLEELSKYQDTLERLMEKNHAQLEDDLRTLRNDFEKQKTQNKKEIRKEVEEMRLVKDDEYQEQIEYLRQQISYLQNKQNDTSQLPAQNMVDQDELFRLEKKISQKIQDLDMKFSNLDDKENQINKQEFLNLDQDVRSKMKDLQTKIDNLQNLTLDSKNNYKSEVSNLEELFNDKIDSLQKQLNKLKLQGVQQTSVYDQQVEIKPDTSSHQPETIIKKNNKAKQVGSSYQEPVQTMKYEPIQEIPVNDYSDDIQPLDVNQYDNDLSQPIQKPEQPINKKQLELPKSNVYNADPYMDEEEVEQNPHVAKGQANPVTQNKVNDVWGYNDLQEIQDIEEIKDDYVDDFNDDNDDDDNNFNFVKPKAQINQVQPPVNLKVGSQPPQEKKSAFEYGGMSESSDEDQEDSYDDDVDNDQVFNILDNNQYNNAKNNQQQQVKPKVKTFEECIEDTKWKKNLSTQDNVENIVDNYLEYQVEKIMKEYGKEHPQAQRLIDEAVFSYL